MNTITIFGIVLIAIGTILTYYGSNIDSIRNQKQTEKLIKKTQEDIKVALKTVDKGTSQQEQLFQIENTFQDWAEKFIFKKGFLIEKHIFENKSVIVKAKNERLKISEQIIPYVEKMIQDITNATNAYNSLNDGHELLIEKKKIPADIFFN